MKINAAIIGFGRMGELYLKEMQNSDTWVAKYICDRDEDALLVAKQLSPDSILTQDESIIFSDPTVQVVILAALADSRYSQVEAAIASGKHVIAEKPLSDKIEKEWAIVRLVENAPILATVNLSLRNAWFNKEIHNFIDSGEIGELAIVRICHMTPGLAPGEGHAPEGPAFHDCGMHYVDLARWLAESEFKTWHAQALDFWDYGEPWWLQCHGTFENGVVFDITQGHVYGQLAKDLTHFSYNDIIGTKGIARMIHDFKNAKLELHGVNKTVILEKEFGDKNIDVLLEQFRMSIEALGTSNQLSGQNGLHPELPTFRDAAFASEYAWRFLEDANKHDLPTIGDKKTLNQILDRRWNKREGYGLLPKRKRK